MSIPGRRKRYSNKETQTDSCAPSPAQEHCARRGSMNASGLWYSTVTHNVKHESFVTDTKNQTDYDQTEYAIVNVPTNKRNTTYSEEHSAYDYVLMN